MVVVNFSGSNIPFNVLYSISICQCGGLCQRGLSEDALSSIMCKHVASKEAKSQKSFY